MRLTRADFFKRAGKTTSCKTASIKFHSERLKFRSFIKDDVDDLMALLSHYEVTKKHAYLGFPARPQADYRADVPSVKRSRCLLCAEGWSGDRAGGVGFGYVLVWPSPRAVAQKIWERNCASDDQFCL